MSPSSLTSTAVPWLVTAWIVTVLVTALLIYLIIRAVLGKTDPEKLPEVLNELTPLLRGVAQALARPLMSLLNLQKTDSAIGRRLDSHDTGSLRPRSLGGSASGLAEQDYPIEGTGIGGKRDNRPVVTEEEL